MVASFDVDNFNASTNRASLPAVLLFCKGSSQSNAARDTKNFLVERGWRVVKEVFKRNRVQVIVGTAKDALMMARALDVSAEKEQSLVACFGDLGNKEDSILLPGPSHEEMPEDTHMDVGVFIDGNEEMNVMPGMDAAAASLHDATNSLPELAGGLLKEVAMESGEPSLELALPTRDQVKAFMVHPDEFCIKFDNLVSEWLDYRFDSGERFVERVLGKPGDEFKNHHIVRDGYHCFTVEGFKRLCLQCPKLRGQQVRTYFIECELEVAKASKEHAPVAMDSKTTLEIEEERTEQARINLEIVKEKKAIVIIKEQRETGRVYKQEETKQKGQDVMVTCTKMKSDASVSIQVEKTKQESEKTKQAELGLRSIELQLQLKRASAGGSSAAGSRTRPRTAEEEEERARLRSEREQKAKEEEEARAERARQREIEKKKRKTKPRRRETAR